LAKNSKKNSLLFLGVNAGELKNSTGIVFELQKHWPFGGSGANALAAVCARCRGIAVAGD
jgi:hypothetical protein